MTEEDYPGIARISEWCPTIVHEVLGQMIEKERQQYSEYLRLRDDAVNGRSKRKVAPASEDLVTKNPPPKLRRYGEYDQSRRIIWIPWSEEDSDDLDLCEISSPPRSPIISK